MEQTIFTIKEAAAFVRLSPRTLERRIAAGELPVYSVNERGDRRFLRDDLLALLERVA